MTLSRLDKAPFPWFADGTVTVDDNGYIWRHRSRGAAIEPRRIDRPDMHKGYRNVRLPVDGRWRTFKAHRLVWAWHHGEDPPGQIDHINGVKDDNRVENLEVVDASENIRRSYQAGRRRPWSDADTWRHKPRITSTDKEAAMTMRANGSTLHEIAAAIGCSVSHAHRITTAGREVTGE